MKEMSLQSALKIKQNSAITIGGFIAAISVEFPHAVYFYFYSRLQFIEQQ